MKILWLINIPLTEASKLLNEKPIPYGGWLNSTAINLVSEVNIELSVTFPHNKARNINEIKGDKINYYPFTPIKNGHNCAGYKELFEKLLKEVKPDIVHIFGTEMNHAVHMVQVCNNLNVKNVISIQGLVSIIEKHMYSGLPISAIYSNTFRNLLRRDSVSALKSKFKARGKNEVEAIKFSTNIIGRTTWDKACSQQINENAKYFNNDETLREEFYLHQWDIKNCEKYSIFLSQGQYPIKGLHFVLEAMPQILKKYPKAKIYVSGKNITKSDTIKDRLLLTYYGKYLRKRIVELKIEDNIVFTGPLDEVQMCSRFLKSHVFVSPSTIENESNSLSEAKILGVPSVASYVGGVIDRIIHGVDGFHYQHDAPYMLAYYVNEIFSSDDLACRLSVKARENAVYIHDRATANKRIIGIYNEILS